MHLDYRSTAWAEHGTGERIPYEGQKETGPVDPMSTKRMYELLACFVSRVGIASLPTGLGRYPNLWK